MDRGCFRRRIADPLTARALFDDATEAPTSAGLDVALGGGGFAVNIPAWDRVVALGSALAEFDDADAAKGQETSHRLRSLPSRRMTQG